MMNDRLTRNLPVCTRTGRRVGRLDLDENRKVAGVTVIQLSTRVRKKAIRV
ncbi:unnamed protein product, partial [Ectocarpus sp. 4 AP-2014]